MDQFASILLAFPPRDNVRVVDNETYHNLAVLHVKRLDKVLKEQTRDLVACSSQLFSIVDPAVNSLSYLTLLHATLFPSPTSSLTEESILEKVVTFMMTFDGRQCRYAGPVLLDLMEAIGNGRLLPPSVAVESLAAAILTLDPTGSLFTSSHLLLAKLAFETDNMEPALPVIDETIVFYPRLDPHDLTQALCDPALPPLAYISRDTGLTGPLKSSAVLEYDLLCGMMYCERRDWTKARGSFERAATYPTKTEGCSKIMVEAFKKWVLVNLLAEGRHSVAPPYLSAGIIRTFEILADPYLSLATAFTTDDVRQLKLEADNNAHLWIEDGNLGLVREVVASYQKWRVISLHHTYAKISISEIREQTKSAETGLPLQKDEDVEELLHDMIAAGMLKGAIETNTNGTKFLVFLPPSLHLSDKEYEEEMSRAVEKLNKLKSISNDTHRRFATSKEYIRWAMRDAGREGRRDAYAEDHAQEDEDLMTAN
ncbi:cop9 subunit [Xylaria sp. CBS 124048]|nr:cop9 subunit [Xylaria sp. CBS 124048]